MRRQSRRWSARLISRKSVLCSSLSFSLRMAAKPLLQPNRAAVHSGRQDTCCHSAMLSHTV